MEWIAEGVFLIFIVVIVSFANPINAVGLDFAADGTAYVAGFENPDFAMRGDPSLYSINTTAGRGRRHRS